MKKRSMLLSVFALLIASAATPLEARASNGQTAGACRIRCDLEKTYCVTNTCSNAWYYWWIYNECVRSCESSQRACYSTCSYLPLDPEPATPEL